MVISITNIITYYLKEEDVLDMLAQCEADEKEGKLTTSNKPRGLKVNFKFELRLIRRLN